MAMAFTACQENKVEPTPVYDDVMRFNLSVPGAPTKVTAAGFEVSDNIGLYVTDYADDATPMPLQISGNRANNLTLTFDGISWTPEKTIYWGEGKSDVYAYYPYMSNISDVNDQYFEVAIDQTGDGYEASDLLWAKAEGVRQSGGAVNLAMKHLMSKLTVKIVAGEDYVGSLPTDASVLLHSTVTGTRINLETGAVEKDPYSGAKSIKMKNLGLRTFADGEKAVVYEAIVAPQMLENSVPLIEINSKSVSYLLEDSFNFRTGVAYTYTATLNTSTTAIKVEIGCEIEDWNNPDDGDSEGGSGEGGEGDGGESGDDDSNVYTDLSAAGTANCYLVQGSGDYKFKAVIGNTDATVGNVKTVEVLWESFGTDEMPNIGDLVASASYKNGYIRFSTPENFREGNAVIAAKNSKGVIIWSWHIWCCEEGWKEQVYYNNAGTMMDRNLGATSVTPDDGTDHGLLYQWGRKDPFLGASPTSGSAFVASTGVWDISGDGSQILSETNPMIFYTYLSLLHLLWGRTKTAYDPCPVGWRVPDGGEEGVWRKAIAETSDRKPIWNGKGHDFAGIFGDDESIWYPASGSRYYSNGHLYEIHVSGSYWSSTAGTLLWCNYNGDWRPSSGRDRGFANSIRCQKEDW